MKVRERIREMWWDISDYFYYTNLRIKHSIERLRRKMIDEDDRTTS